jgi:hypothetical protein
MDTTSQLGEEVRNRLLRRVDWRFLLPTPEPGKSICFARGLLRRAVRLISDRMADEKFDSTSTDCDLAVAIGPNRATLRECWSALRPGGSLYTEWYSPLGGGPNGVRRRLEAAGFDQVRCYWAWPWPCLSRPRFWLPLEAPGAVDYFLLSRPPAPTAVRRLAAIGLRALWLSSLRLGVTVPICALARKPGVSVSNRLSTASRSALFPSRSSAPVISPDLLDKIRAQWRTLGLGSTPDRLSSLVLTGGPRSVGKVVALVFAEPDPSPRLAVKMPRVPESVPGLIREATTLRSIQTRHPGRVKGIPRILFCQEQASLLTVGETAFTGWPMSALLRPENSRDFALKVTDWLGELPGSVAPRPPTTWWNRLIEPVLTGFEESFGSVVDSAMLQETKDALATFGALPLVCEQRDFGPWNVLVTADRELAVLDWESSEPEGLPVLDLIYFLSYLAFLVDGIFRRNGALRPDRVRESYRMALDPSTFLGSVRSECLARYTSHIGLDSDALRPLGLLVWLIHSRSEYKHFAADAAGRPERETLRRSLFVSLWEEELRNDGKRFKARHRRCEDHRIIERRKNTSGVSLL